MLATNYEVTTSVAGFEEGDILDVTARFGEWHAFALKLEHKPTSPGSRTVVVTGEETGFSEKEILDETARIGDWHEYDLKFDPEDPEYDSSARIRLDWDMFQQVTRPVEATA